ncbi:MAG: hypothetical protein F6K40_06175 [Okeania sp. SIO3I5]|uniref:hypothetical protein n=1 Tax=Okeania sp. SIO3I5 TaxID=2607805 RepID=UPI0013B92606|nr:hypothetical protein [Okeania sp. SIO3I5]NEQ35895.1 hypothetical protein [Okeania sp. SIO3I5]
MERSNPRVGLVGCVRRLPQIMVELSKITWRRNAPSNYLPSQKKVRDGKISRVSRKLKRARHGFCHGCTDDVK